MSLAERIAQEFNTVRGEITESDSTAVKLTGSQTIEGVKTFTSSIQGNLVGNSATATKLATPRKITISGDVSGNVSIDGSTDVTLSAEVANDSHFHSTSTITGLGTAATKDVGENADNVMEVGAFGLGTGGVRLDTGADLNSLVKTGFYATYTSSLASTILNSPTDQSFGLTVLPVGAYPFTSSFQILQAINSNTIWTRYALNGTWSNWEKLIHTGNILQSTGTSTDYPMSQKATTDAINTTVVKLTGNQTIDGIKTFSESPIVPTPTTDYQVATKEYVDSPINWVANDTRAKTALNANGDAPIYACRAWVNFNGTGRVAIRASGNVSSITDNAVGRYTVNFATAMPDTYYATTTMCNYILGEGSSTVLMHESHSLSTTYITLSARWDNIHNSTRNREFCNVSIFR
jgi:hypothetical protein